MGIDFAQLREQYKDCQVNKWKVKFSNVYGKWRVGYYDMGFHVMEEFTLKESAVEWARNNNVPA